MMLLRKDRKRTEEYRILPNSFGERHVKIDEHLGDGIFLTNQNSLGCVYKLDCGIYDEPLTPNELAIEIDAFQKLFRNILPGIPFGQSNVVIQVNCAQREQDHFSFIEPINEMAKFLSEEERYTVGKGIVERTIYISILLESKLGIIDQIKERLQLGATDDEFAFLRVIESRKSVLIEELERMETETELQLKRLDCEEVVEYYNSILNYGKKTPFSISKSSHLSFNQLVFNEPMKGTKRGLYSEEDPSRSIRVFIFTHVPDVFVLGRLKTFLSELPIAWDMVWTMSDGRTERTMEMIAKQMWFAAGPAFEDVRKDMASFASNVGPLKPYGKFSLRLVVYNIDKAMERRIIRSAIQTLNVPIMCEDQLGPHMIAACLPMNCTSEVNAIVGRHRTLRLNSALGFLPVYDGHKGKGYRIMRSNRGFEARYDRFAGEQNRTTVTQGKSGSGKSVGNVNDIMEFKARFPDGVVMMVDNKTSSDRLAGLLGGKVVKFSEGYLKENPYSPFAVENWDAEDIELVVSFIASSIAQLNPDAKFAGDHSEVLVEAIKMCINKHLGDLEWVAENPEERAGAIAPHFTWTQVLENLEPAGVLKGFKGAMSVVDEIRRWTVSFGETGQFGYLFSGHERPRDDSHGCTFIIYDLAGISDARLQSIAAKLVALKIVRDIKKISRRIHKYIIFEELGVYLKGDSEATQEMANRLVLNITKTVRKYNGIPHGITNSVEDFFDTPGGKSFWAQATRKIFYPMSADMVQALKEKAPDLTEADLDIISSLHMRDGEYTQSYIIIDSDGGRKIKVLTEVPLSPKSGALTITSGTISALYEELRADGHSVVDALKKVEATLERKPT